ncbi:hypothetical protein F444_17788 [Phytophthora nicotianae P1976]|uniref:SWIM-type domain-containing protein n=2 Tax=Phytophthora nicotianae TaxID=4792 RepID=A0A080ZDT3_PHYNI|nr:hypothetical protein F444_17788 [Phytophthora nicotianae P1976]
MASTPEGLSDEEKAVASMFYRSAVKWSVRRAHHVGMPQEGWLVRINIFQCKCPYFRKFLLCAHVVCGRAAAGLSVPGVDGYHLRFKDRRGRRASQLRHIKLANFPVLNELNRHS